MRVWVVIVSNYQYLSISLDCCIASGSTNGPGASGLI